MNEEQWKVSQDSHKMLLLALGRRSHCCGRVWHREMDGSFAVVEGQPLCPGCLDQRQTFTPIMGDRKLRLFTAACTRLRWDELNETSQLAVETGEDYADNERYPSLMADIRQKTWELNIKPRATGFWQHLAFACTAPNDQLLFSGLGPVTLIHVWRNDKSLKPYFREFADLLRDIVGNPWQPIGLPWVQDLSAKDGLQPPYCPWLTPLVTSITQDIYNRRDFDCLPILADALEEAGCTELRLLQHLRGKERCLTCGGSGWHPARGDYPVKCTVCKGTGWADLSSSHVRGCWAHDLILGKE